MRGVSCLRRSACSHMLAPVAESASHTTRLGIVCGGFLRAVTDHEPSRETSPFGEVLPLCGQLHLTLQQGPQLLGKLGPADPVLQELFWAHCGIVSPKTEQGSEYCSQSTTAL